MKPFIWQLILLLALASAPAVAQTLLGVTMPSGGGGAITPPTCNGTIDLSKGCALPMFGGL